MSQQRADERTAGDPAVRSRQGTADATASRPTPAVERRHYDPNLAVILDDVHRAFDDQKVLEGINMDVTPGQIFGLVGPSGCGKTTLVRLLVGLLRPTSGTVLVRGVVPLDFTPKDRFQIGYVPQEFSLYPTLTVWENARFIAGLYGLGWRKRGKRIKEVLSFLDIWDARNRLARDISGGMRRRLSLAGAMLHEPQLMIVDEPTAGLDPMLRIRIWELLHQIRSRGTTIFLTTQHIEEAERCDSVAVLSGGRLAASGTPSALREHAQVPDVLEVRVKQISRDLAEPLWRIPGVRSVEWQASGDVRLRVRNAVEVRPKVIAELDRHGAGVIDTQIRQATFEEVFMRLVERG